eukprot:6186859-Pleurochrysis_carterae.AAC.1
MLTPGGRPSGEAQASWQQRVQAREIQGGRARVCGGAFAYSLVLFFVVDTQRRKGGHVLHAELTAFSICQA